MINTQPIGIFDSGVGGISVFKELQLLLPHEHTIYLADSKNAPYGAKSQEEIIALSIKNTQWLIHKKCKLIVVACNTATTNAIKTLRSTIKVPLIGIEPAIKPAAIHTKTKNIGVLATKGTLSSHLFSKTTNLFANGINIVEQVGEGIVALIEQGKIDSVEMKTLLKCYLKPMLASNIDYLVLGCTHYSYLIPLLKTFLPRYVQILDSGEPTARHTKTVLEQFQLINPSKLSPKNTFYTNINPTVINHLLGPSFKATYLDF